MPRFDETVPLAQAFEPLSDIVAVEIMTEDEKTTGGVLLSHNARRKEVFARVAALGALVNDALNVIRTGPESATLVETSARKLEVGDWVVTSPHAGYDLEWGGGEYKVIRAIDVFGVMKVAPLPAAKAKEVAP